MNIKEIINKPKQITLDKLKNGKYFIEPKIDGERVLIFKDGNEILIHNKYNTVYSKEVMPKLFSILEKSILRNCILDAEFYYKGGDLYDFLSARNEDNDNLSLSIFDILQLDNEAVRYKNLSERKEILSKIIIENERISLMPYNIVYCPPKDAIKKIFDDYVQKGYEGIVIKPDSFYYAEWYKMKKTETTYAVILGIKKTNSWIENRLAQTFLIGDKDLKPLGYVSSGLSLNEKSAISEVIDRIKINEDEENIYVKPLIVLEIEYQSREENGLRHPRIRRLRLDLSPSML
jgi:ATP-dependent DNA ligase